MRLRSSVAERYKIKEHLPSSFTTNWIFIVEQDFLTSNQTLSIKNLYSKLLPIARTQAIPFNPLGFSLQDFQLKFRQVKKDSLMTKIVASPTLAEKIMIYLKQKNQLNLIDQLYVVSNHKSYNLGKFKLKMEFSNIVVIKNQIDQIISLASEEIDKWRLKFQILRNVLPLNGSTFNQKAFEYRIRMHVCVRLNYAKHKQYLKKFEDYISREIDSRGIWDKEWQSKANFQQTQIMRNLEQCMEYYRQMESVKNKIEELSQKQISGPNKELEDLVIRKKMHQGMFTTTILKLYQAQLIFYEIINQGVKKFTKRQFDWESLALPICLLYNAVKLVYGQQREQFERKIKQTLQFNVWRGGKISIAELDEIINNLSKHPLYYEFLSFVSTSTDINTAIQFLSCTQRQIKKMNCLFKFIIKLPKTKLNCLEDFFQHGYCNIPNFIGDNEREILLNALTVGKIVKVEVQSLNKLKKKYHINRQLIQNYAEHDKFPLITVEIGTFEELFTSLPTLLSNNKEQQAYKQQVKLYKRLILNYKYTIDKIKECKELDFAYAYEMCNDLQQSYDKLLTQINELTQKQLHFAKSSQSQNQNVKLHLFYSQQNIYLRLSNVCRKLGRQAEALLYTKLAIDKCKQLQQFDKHRIYQEYEERLNRMYKLTSQILLEDHQYNEATKFINTKIDQLNNIKDQLLRKRNQVIISRLLLDLGVANFKEGNNKIASEKFVQSSSNIDKIYKDINYDEINKEEFRWEWIKDVFVYNKPEVTFNDGLEKYNKTKREEKIKIATQLYGGREKLITVKNNAEKLSLEVAQSAISHKQYFCGSEGQRAYEKIIRQRKAKVQKNMKDQLASQETFFINSQIKEKNTQNLKKIIEKQSTQNKYEQLKEQMKNCFLFEESINLQQIKQQQTSLQEYKRKIEQFRLHFWQRPEMYLQSDIDFQSEYSELLLNKQQIHRKKIYQSTQISLQQLTEYFKQNAKSINHYLEDLQKWGYSQSTAKVLKQYNRLIVLYLQIQNQSDAEKLIDDVKRLSNVKGEQKYFQSAVAYFLKGKIYQSAAEIDYLHLIDTLWNQKYHMIKQKQMINVESALNQFDESYANFERALIKDGKRDAFIAEPQQISLRIWRIKSLIFQSDSKQNQQKPDILKDINSCLGQAREAIRNLDNNSKFQLQSDLLQAEALYYFRCKKYKESLKSFEECVAIREQKLGALNWQNMLVYAKIIFLFCLVEQLKPQLQKYAFLLQKNYTRYKDYPFEWKISLARYYLSRENKAKVEIAIQILEHTLALMERQKFMDENFYNQYELLYHAQYQAFVKKNKLKRQMMPKAERKLTNEKERNIIDEEEDQGAKSIEKKMTNNAKNINTIRIKQKTNFSTYLRRSTASKSVNPNLLSETKKQPKLQSSINIFLSSSMLSQFEKSSHLDSSRFKSGMHTSSKLTAYSQNNKKSVNKAEPISQTQSRYMASSQKETQYLQYDEKLEQTAYGLRESKTFRRTRLKKY